MGPSPPSPETVRGAKSNTTKRNYLIIGFKCELATNIFIIQAVGCRVMMGTLFV